MIRFSFNQLRFSSVLDGNGTKFTSQSV